MKLAIVTTYPPGEMFLQTYAYHLVKHLAQHEEIHELLLLTDKSSTSKDVSFTTKGCWIKVNQCWEYNGLNNISSVKRAILKAKPDAVLFNLRLLSFGNKKLPAALGLLLPKIIKALHIPTLVVMHDVVEQGGHDALKFEHTKLVQYAYKKLGSLFMQRVLKADRVVVTMKSQKEVLQNKYKAKNVAFIPHGTFEIPETPSFNREGCNRVLLYGTFGTQKKVVGVLEAVKKLISRTDLNIEVVIAGTSSAFTPGYLDRVKMKYEDMANVTFTGAVEDYEVPAIFKHSDVVVFSDNDVSAEFSAVLSTAAAYGRALVLQDKEVFKSAVDSMGYKALYYGYDEENALEIVLEDLFIDYEMRNAMGIHNYSVIRDYPFSKIASLYLKMLKDIINGTPDKETQKDNKTSLKRNITVLK